MIKPVYKLAVIKNGELENMESLLFHDKIDALAHLTNMPSNVVVVESIGWSLVTSERHENERDKMFMQEK